MLKFYDVNVAYTNYLRNYDSRIPNIVYSSNNKFVCGVVLKIGNYDYFAPLSSQKTKQQTNILIKDSNGTVLSSIKFCFMFPAPPSTVQEKDFRAIRAVDPTYADLLEKEYEFCKKNESAICQKAEKIYRIGCNPHHILYNNCCDFRLLERKQDEWLKIHS